MPVTDEQAISDLMALDDEAFVDEAYVLLLGREADSVGQFYYMGRLRDGKSKRQVILQLVKSPESVALQQDSPMLRASLETWYRKSASVFNKFEDVLRFQKVWKLFKRSKSRRQRDAALERHISILMESNARITESLANIQATLSGNIGASASQSSASPQSISDEHLTGRMSRQTRVIYSRLIQSKDDLENICVS
jgi:hypothetical protein